MLRESIVAFITGPTSTHFFSAIQELIYTLLAHHHLNITQLTTMTGNLCERLAKFREKIDPLHYYLLNKEYPSNKTANKKSGGVVEA